MSAVRTVKLRGSPVRVVQIVGGAPGATMKWQGDWSSATVYAPLDAVADAGSSYLCTDAVGPSATHPGSDGAHWALLAEKGTDGTGTVNSVNGVSPDGSHNVTLGADDIDGFATVAISGSYDDLVDTPAIPDSPDDIGAAPAASALGVTVTDKSSAYTLAAADAGSVIRSTASGAITITVPASTFASGQIVEVLQYGAGQVTVAAGSGVTLRLAAAGLKTKAQYSSFSILFLSATEAVVSGDGSA